MKESEERCSVAIIDSITHVWLELMTSYQRRLNRRHGLQFQDWGKLKLEWRQFTDAYLNSNLHVILCGRAGYEYDHQENEGGKKELVKTGTKMKAESEMGYEPSLLIEMLRVKKSEETKNIKDKGWVHRAVVLKDRTDTMNGKEIDAPKYEDFGSIISFLNIGGSHLGIDTSRTSDEMFDCPDMSASEFVRQRTILAEKVKEAIIEGGVDGSSQDAKTKRVAALKAAFGTSSWTAISEGMRLEEMRTGLTHLRTGLGLE
jgi:hypothetical protein